MAQKIQNLKSHDTFVFSNPGSNPANVISEHMHAEPFRAPAVPHVNLEAALLR